MEITIWLAFIAGLVSFLSPCVLPLVPVYLAQISGASIQDNQIQVGRRVLLLSSLGFIFGFTLIFMILGASSTLIGQFFASNRILLEQLGSIVIFLFGLQMMGLITFDILNKEKKFNHVQVDSKFKWMRSTFTGLIFGAAWTPCIGLVLSSILILSSQSETLFSGMSLLFIYSMGLAVPFLLVALIWSKSINKLKRINRFLPVIQKISGGVMIVLAILLFTGQFRILAAYLAQFVPFSI